MDTQTLLALLLVLAAALYMGRRAWRTLRAGAGGGSGTGKAQGGDGCGPSCGCH
ncbi:MAG TPA: hypothetical protein VFS08_10765 [Gemmatimonadaceae bacterium]|nr:hypothetical protein [Gemmatimonadaceae bacterium]